jgi:PAS domain S-box-containing protein
MLQVAGGSLVGLRKALTRPFTAWRAAGELKEAYELLHERYGQLERVEAALRESEERFRSLVEASSECIGHLDLNGNFLYANPTCLRVLGKTQNEVRGTNFTRLTTPEFYDLFNGMLDKARDGESVQFQYKSDSNSGEKWFESVLTPIHGESGQVKSLLRIARNITEQKRIEEEMKLKLMKFRLMDGTLYLVKESSPGISIEAFKDLLNIGYGGLVFSRELENDFRETIGGDYEYVWLSEIGKDSISPSIDAIKERIGGMPRKTGVFIGRLDYIIFKNGFEKTLAFIQWLKDKGSLNNLVIIVSIDPKTLNEIDLRLLEKETAEVEPIQKGVVSEKHLEILRFVHSQNLIGPKPSFTDVGREFGMSKPTVRKIMKFLQNAEYILVELNGSKKILTINEKGRRLF